MLLIVLWTIVLFLLLFIYSACVVASKYSREEEEYEHTRNV